MDENKKETYTKTEVDSIMEKMLNRYLEIMDNHIAYPKKLRKHQQESCKHDWVCVNQTKGRFCCSNCFVLGEIINLNDMDDFHNIAEELEL